MTDNQLEDIRHSIQVLEIVEDVLKSLENTMAAPPVSSGLGYTSDALSQVVVVRSLLKRVYREVV